MISWTVDRSHFRWVYFKIRMLLSDRSAFDAHCLQLALCRIAFSFYSQPTTQFSIWLILCIIKMSFRALHTDFHIDRHRLGELERFETEREQDLKAYEVSTKKSCLIVLKVSSAQRTNDDKCMAFCFYFGWRVAIHTKSRGIYWKSARTNRTNPTLGEFQ